MLRGELLLDVRGLDHTHRRPIVFGVIDHMVELGCQEQMVLVTDHEPAGLGYQIDLRRETRGRFEFSYDQRSDGAWVVFLRPKRT